MLNTSNEKHRPVVASDSLNNGLLRSGENVSQFSRLIPCEIIQVESNLLHYPFFWLHTKNLKNVKGIEVTGSKQIEGKHQNFTYRVTRNSDLLYPGLEARKVHIALLSKLSDPKSSSYPFQNPINFSWRELADRARLKWGGTWMTDQLKDAIRCTHGVVITSNYALVRKTKSISAKQKKVPLKSRERGYKLYENYAFADELAPDGTISDTNYVTFADWYLTNLNDLQSAPLKHELWARLDEVSAIASRSYEFLLYKCGGRTKAEIPIFTINYPKFASFLPITVYSHASRAEQQLEKAFTILRQENVIDDVRWLTSCDGQIQLKLSLGAEIRNLRRSTALFEDSQSTIKEKPELLGNLDVRPILNDESPENALVRRFHEKWFGKQTCIPLKSELKDARELIALYGLDSVHEIFPQVVKTMKKPRPEGFPEAKTFCAARRCFEAVASKQIAQKGQGVIEEAKRKKYQEEDELVRNRKVERLQRKKALLKIWDELSSEQQDQIRKTTIDKVKGRALKEVLRNSGDPQKYVQFLDQLAEEHGLPRFRRP